MPQLTRFLTASVSARQRSRVVEARRVRTLFLASLSSAVLLWQKIRLFAAVQTDLLSHRSAPRPASLRRSRSRRKAGCPDRVRSLQIWWGTPRDCPPTLNEQAVSVSRCPLSIHRDSTVAACWRRVNQSANNDRTEPAEHVGTSSRVAMRVRADHEDGGTQRWFAELEYRRRDVTSCTPLMRRHPTAVVSFRMDKSIRHPPSDRTP